MAILLFQTLPSTSVTTLHLSMRHREGLGNEGSLAFKEFILGSKAKDSPLRELSLTYSYGITKGWTELFNVLCSSCITTLDVSDNNLNGEECSTALKYLLINNKTLAVLKIGHWYETNDDVVYCIADALSQNCSLMELTIRTYRLSILKWTKLFESLHKNATLNTLDCYSNKFELHELDQNNEVAKSLCEMLIHNQGLQNLNIADKLIEGHLKEFAMAYIQRKTVLNLTVGKLEDEDRGT